MTKWIILASVLDAESSSIRTIASLDCSEEEAFSELSNILNSYDRGVMKVIRREIFKITDRSFLLRISGRLSQSQYIIQLGELVADTKGSGVPESI